MTFIASDGKTQTSQTIAITVANTDRPPVLADVGNPSVNAGSLLTFTLSATDPDGDSLTYSAGTLPSGAALTGPTFAWTPDVQPGRNLFGHLHRQRRHADQFQDRHPSS